MKEYDLHQLLASHELVKQKIENLLKSGLLKKQEIDPEEIKGHLEKADHNLKFVFENIKLGFFGWSITGCYYASYHAALSLILTKGYSSKNHLATMCVLIQEFYAKKLISKEEIEILSSFIDYQDLLFYVESKNKREHATYSTQTRFDKKEAEQIHMKAILFVNKCKSILKTANIVF